MAKRERLEDLGRLHELLKELKDRDIFDHTDSKHGFEEWVKFNHGKEEYGEPKGLFGIFSAIRGVFSQIEECYYITCGDHEE